MDNECLIARSIEDETSARLLRLTDGGVLMKFKCCLPLRCPSCRGSLPMYLLFTTYSSKKIRVCRHCQAKYRFADLCNVVESAVISLVFFVMLVAMLAGALRLQWLIFATFDQREVAVVLALVFTFAVPAVIMCSYLGIAIVFTNKVERWVPTCQKCGYNLRGLSGDHCPECGKSFDRNSPAFTGDRKPTHTERLVDWIARELSLPGPLWLAWFASARK